MDVKTQKQIMEYFSKLENRRAEELEDMLISLWVTEKRNIAEEETQLKSDNYMQIMADNSNHFDEDVQNAYFRALTRDDEELNAFSVITIGALDTAYLEGYYKALEDIKEKTNPKFRVEKFEIEEVQKMQELDKIIKELKTRKLEELEKDFINGRISQKEISRLMGL